MTVSASASVAAGAPDQSISGEMPSPEHVKRVGITAPSANAGLDRESGPEDGDGATVAPALAPGVAGNVGDAMAGETNGVPLGLAGPVPADVHAEMRMVISTNQTTDVRRMARLST
jgi:hypothetical protein